MRKWHMNTEYMNHKWVTNESHELYYRLLYRVYLISLHVLSSPTDVGKWAKGWDIWFNATQSSATNVDTTIQAIHGLFRQA